MPRPRPPLTRRGFLGAAGLTAAGLVAACDRTPGLSSGVTDSGWADLRAGLRGRVVRPGEAGYTDLATPRNLRFAAVMPAAVVLCAGAEDVAAALRWARKTNTPFAIRGGGHNYVTASSSVGIIISTRRMNAARIDGNTLYAEAGMLNADLSALLPQGGMGTLLLPGGYCPAVGVTGLTLGGGIGPNGPWAGLTADRLRRATMVTAAGDVVSASNADNPDLFWGLRGGAGGNFGVVTDLDYELVEIPVTRATTARLTVTGRDAALTAALAFQTLRAGAERTATGKLSMYNHAGDVEAELTAQVLGDEATAREMLAALLTIPGVRAEVTERPWWDAYAWHAKESTPPNSFWDRSLYADEFLPADALAAALDVVRRFPAAGSAGDSAGVLGLMGWVGGAVGDVAPDATAYVHRRAEILVTANAEWPTPTAPVSPAGEIPPEIRSWAEELWEVLLPHTTGRSYQNFPDPELQDPAGAYYGDNLARLEGLKAAWDPDDVFTYSQGIPLPR